MNKKAKKKKGITVDELAIMVQRGFEDTASKTDTASKADIARIDSRLSGIDVRLDRIENLLLRGHDNRIELLEDKMRMVQTALACRK